MSDINVRVVSQDATQVKLGTQNAIKVLSSSAGGAGTLGGLADLDISGGLANGMVLVYNSGTSKWEATLQLTPGDTQNLNINGGSF
tara:strand:+ start:272 stop:529 length:258 start_codon:yes stop_codon:yes gene_type:complete